MSWQQANSDRLKDMQDTAVGILSTIHGLIYDHPQSFQGLRGSVPEHLENLKEEIEVLANQCYMLTEPEGT